MGMLKRDARLSQDFQKIQIHINQNTGEIPVDPGLIPQSVSLVLEHQYLEEAGSSTHWGLEPVEDGMLRKMTWMQLDRLPVQYESDKTGLIGRWKSVLSAAHRDGEKIAVVLTRINDKTKIYVGAWRNREGDLPAEQMRENILHFMGGQMHPLESKKGYPYPVEVQDFSFAGLLTGIPSAKSADSTQYLQTLDHLAAGIKLRGISKNYGVVIRADAVSDGAISDLIQKLLKLKQDLQPLTQWDETVSNGSVSESKQKQSAIHEGTKTLAIAGGLLSILTYGAELACPPVAPLLEGFRAGNQLITGTAQSLAFITRGDGPSTTHNPGSIGTTRHYSDERVKYLLGQMDEQIARLEKGRSTGFWNTAVYVLAEDIATVDTALNRLSGVFRGEQSYLDPIRSYAEGIRRGPVCSYAVNMELMPLARGRESFMGQLYQYIATPINTDELALECNLPRQAHTGLERAVDAVRFSYNPPCPNSRSIRLGTVYSEGRSIGKPFWLQVDALQRHGVMVGESGSGKSVTTRKILEGLMELGIPFLVIDPVKDSYLDMAIEYNLKHQNDPDFEKKRIRIYQPGDGTYDYCGQSIPLDQFGINLYRPAAFHGAPIDLKAHINRLTELLIVSMGLDYSLPELLREGIRTDLEAYYGSYVHMRKIPAEAFLEEQPSIKRLQFVMEQIMEDKTYAEEIRGNLRQCMENLLRELDCGWKRCLISAPDTSNPAHLFDHPTVISLKGLGSDKDKAFAISILMQWLRDYRESCYQYDLSYRRQAKKNHLMHLTVIEEAHAVLGKPSAPIPGVVDPRIKSAEIMEKILSEVREYGQGILVVDQYASRLIEDVRKNSNVTLIHQLQSMDESQLMAQRISLEKQQAAYLPRLQQGHLIAGYGSNEPCWVRVDYPRDLQ